MWQTIDTAPRDGTQKLFYAPLCGAYIAPDLPPVEPTLAEKRAIYEYDGSWPNAGYNATHWMPLPEPPEAV